MKLSGVDIEDSEMDILMEEIIEKWEEVEVSDFGCSSKEKVDLDWVIGEEIRWKVCEKFGEMSKWNVGEKVEFVVKKLRRSGSEIFDFFKEKMSVW